jgi:hypothetical protein
MNHVYDDGGDDDGDDRNYYDHDDRDHDCVNLNYSLHHILINVGQLIYLFTVILY